MITLEKWKARHEAGVEILSFEAEGMAFEVESFGGEDWMVRDADFNADLGMITLSPSGEPFTPEDLEHLALSLEGYITQDDEGRA